MRTVAKQTHFSLRGPSTNVNQERQMTLIDVQADAFHKVSRPLTFDANQAYLVLVKLVEPVSLTIGAGANSIMRDTALTQRLGQTIEQDRFPCVGWPTKKYSG